MHVEGSDVALGGDFRVQDVVGRFHPRIGLAGYAARVLPFVREAGDGHCGEHKAGGGQGNGPAMAFRLTVHFNFLGAVG